MPECHVTEAHARIYERPIVARAGDRARLGRRDDETPGWIWVEHQTTGLAGWAPEAFLDRDDAGGTAVFNRNDDAIELTVEAGQTVEAGETMAGWTWCRARDGQAGWVPSSRLAPA